MTALEVRTAVPSRAQPDLEQDQLAGTLGPGRIWPTVAAAADGFTAHPAAK